MEITGKVLREVEFRDRLRGYDTDEVDEFLEEVAVAVDGMHERIAELTARLDKAPAAAPVDAPAAEPLPAFDDESIRRTLVLAQRTADLAIREANEEAQRLVQSARDEAESLLSQATENARRLRDEADQDYQRRVSAQLSEREQLEREVRQLSALVGEERERIVESLQTLLRFVTENVNLSDELADRAAPEPFEPRSRSVEEALFDDSTVANGAAAPESRPTTTPMPAVPGPAAGEKESSSDTDEELWKRWSESDSIDDPIDETDPFGFNRR